MTAGPEVAAVLRAIVPGDEQERSHLEDALAWSGSTDDVYRRVPPRTPPKHLVSYVLLRDETDGSVLLVDHRRSGLWLPAGGHVEPGEHPADAARREAAEELGASAVFADPLRRPAFVTVTETVGDVEVRHVDVTLWYLLAGSRRDVLAPDERELAGVRWWSRRELAAAPAERFDPHLGRFLTKIGRPR